MIRLPDGILPFALEEEDDWNEDDFEDEDWGEEQDED